MNDPVITCSQREGDRGSVTLSSLPEFRLRIQTRVSLTPGSTQPPHPDATPGDLASLFELKRLSSSSNPPNKYVACPQTSYNHATPSVLAASYKQGKSEDRGRCDLLITASTGVQREGAVKTYTN